MRRTIARGRLVPQSLSTDPRMGRLSLKAALLFPLMWINCDDQGRISGDPDEVKYAVCPNIEHIARADIPELLRELETHEFIKVYATSKTKAIQMLDWWEEEKLQWAYPSRYPPPEGWTDHLRYHPTPKEIITENWPPPERLGKELASDARHTPGDGLGSELGSALQPDKERSKEIIENEKGKRKGRGRGRGRLPSALGSNPPLANSSLLNKLHEVFPEAWGRAPDSRETAQLRDLERELSAAGGAAAEQICDAFKEAAAENKLHVSYVRAILCDWLGIPRNRSP